MAVIPPKGGTIRYPSHNTNVKDLPLSSLHLRPTIPVHTKSSSLINRVFTGSSIYQKLFLDTLLPDTGFTGADIINISHRVVEKYNSLTDVAKINFKRTLQEIYNKIDTLAEDDQLDNILVQLISLPITKNKKVLVKTFITFARNFLLSIDDQKATKAFAQELEQIKSKKATVEAEIARIDERNSLAFQINLLGKGIEEAEWPVARPNLGKFVNHLVERCSSLSKENKELFIKAINKFKELDLKGKLPIGSPIVKGITAYFLPVSANDRDFTAASEIFRYLSSETSRFEEKLRGTFKEPSSHVIEDKLVQSEHFASGVGPNTDNTAFLDHTNSDSSLNNRVEFRLIGRKVAKG